MTNKKGSTLLLALCLFFVFLIFVGALIPLSQRSFEKTATDVVQQQADYIAQSALTAFVNQLDEEMIRGQLQSVAESNSSSSSSWTAYGTTTGRVRIVLTGDALFNAANFTSNQPRQKYHIIVQAEAEYEGKTAQMSAVVQMLKVKNAYYDMNGSVPGIFQDITNLKRAVLINECRVPTPSSANFWINAISDQTVTQENLNGMVGGSSEKIELPAGVTMDDQVALIYRNIQSPTLVGNIEGNVYLEPADYTSAILGSDQPGQLIIQGDVICRGNLILQNATIKGNVYASGSIKKKGMVEYSTLFENLTLDNEVFNKYDTNQPLLSEPLHVETFIKLVTDDSQEAQFTVKEMDNIYKATHSDLKSLHVINEIKRNDAYFELEKMPDVLIVESKNKYFRPVFYIQDENPILSSQVTTNLLSSENIILVFSHPVTIRGDINVSVVAPKIIFEAENIVMNGRFQACEFENSQLVSSVNLKAREFQSYHAYTVPVLNSEDYYYFDLLYYQK
ncbi:hypothetical protein [Holdemania massiliensis]|uniref:hypothetical protein n=1 Tax=Holdemania massiliensis TaxID=1468449 RepID=UPI001F06531B|nr:hypothetical protein [Holdemania massiliensis]MCH1941050.1 hypothetical protein [Holdemania massiliensis]